MPAEAAMSDADRREVQEALHRPLRSAMTEEPKRMGPLIRNLRRNTDPLFRRAGISLDGW